MYKRAVKKLLRPVTRRIFTRVDARIAPVDARITPVAADVQSLRGDVDALKLHLPTVLNTISSQNAVLRAAKRGETRLDGELNAIRERISNLTADLASLTERLDALAADISLAGSLAAAGARQTTGCEQAAPELPRDGYISERPAGMASHTLPSATLVAGADQRTSAEGSDMDRFNGAGA